MRVTRCPSTRRLLRQLSTTSNESSFSVEQSKPTLVKFSTHRRRRPSVIFDESENEVYFNHEDLTEEEVEAVWYSEEELESLRQETARLAQDLLKDLGSGSWTRSIRRAFLGFCEASSLTDVDLIKKNWKLPIEGFSRGLERLMLPPRERQIRRQKLIRRVLYISQKWQLVRLSPVFKE